MPARCVGVRKSAVALTMFGWLRLRSEWHHSSALTSACYHKGAAICVAKTKLVKGHRGESTGMQGKYEAIEPHTLMGAGELQAECCLPA